MSALSNYLENVIINHILRNQSYTPPSTIYLALYTTAPSEEGGGTEVSGNGYARQAITLSEPSDGQTSNSNTIIFPQATGNWGTIVAVGIFDASTGGNLLLYGNLSQSKTINTNDIFQVPAGSLTITFD